MDPKKTLMIRIPAQWFNCTAKKKAAVGCFFFVYELRWSVSDSVNVVVTQFI